MEICLKMAFNEEAAVRFLNTLAEVNASIHARQKGLPLLYDAGVVYRREAGEVWCDILNMYARGYEDCDALAAARTGEVLALGWRAFRPGDPGYEVARQLRPERVKARCLLSTRVPKGQTGLYHCISEYRLNGRWYIDDPSARLGMNGQFDPAVERRWKVAGLNTNRLRA